MRQACPRHRIRPPRQASPRLPRHVEPESAEEQVATASTSPTMEELSAGWTNWRGDAGRTGVADAGPTGEPVQLWRVSADGTCTPPPAVVGGVVYAPCMVVLYALDASTGTERWRFAGTSLDEVPGCRVESAQNGRRVVDEAAWLLVVDVDEVAPHRRIGRHVRERPCRSLTTL